MKFIICICILLALCGHGISQNLNNDISGRQPFIIQPRAPAGNFRDISNDDIDNFRQFRQLPATTTGQEEFQPTQRLRNPTTNGNQVNPNRRPNNNNGGFNPNPNNRPPTQVNSGRRPNNNNGQFNPNPNNRPPTQLTQVNSGRRPNNNIGQRNPINRSPPAQVNSGRQPARRPSVENRQNPQQISTGRLPKIEIVTSDEIYDDYDEENYPTLFLERPASRQNVRRPSSRRPSSSNNTPVIYLQLVQPPTNTNSQNSARQFFPGQLQLQPTFG